MPKIVTSEMDDPKKQKNENASPPKSTVAKPKTTAASKKNSSKVATDATQSSPEAKETEPKPDKTGSSATKPAKASAAQPVTKPAKAAAAQPATKPAKAAAAQPATKPAKAAAEQPATKPAKAAAEQPATKPAKAASEQPATKPAKAAAEQPVAKPAKAAAEQPATKPAKAAAEQPATKPAKAAAAQPVAKPAKAAAEQPVAKPAKAAAEQPATKPAKAAAEQPAAKPAKAAAEQPATKPAKAAAEQPVAKPAKAAAEQPAAKPAKAAKPAEPTKPTPAAKPTQPTTPATKAAKAAAATKPTPAAKPTQPTAPATKAAKPAAAPPTAKPTQPTAPAAKSSPATTPAAKPTQPAAKSSPATTPAAKAAKPTAGKKKLRVVLKKKQTEARPQKEKKLMKAVSLDKPIRPLQTMPKPVYRQSPTHRTPYKPGGGGPNQATGPRWKTEGPSAPSTDQSQSQKRFFKKKHDYKKQKDQPQEKELLQKWKKRHVVRANPVPSQIEITDTVTVADLARKMNLKASELIQRLFGMGMMISINEAIDADTAEILANEYDCKVKVVSLYDQTIIETEEDIEGTLQPRPPIVTILGHVDHGKTSLLDAIRNTDIAAGEHGAITQHIGAYQTHTSRGPITFLDTPGHEAFTQMRARGAQVTDIVVLVVAADDGLMPQTLEAISHARDAKVPIIVAISKIDLPKANSERVQQELSQHDLIPEKWGGKTIVVEVSAVTGEGMENLLENIILQAEIMELQANYQCRAEGKIIESMIDTGLGRTSTVLIQRGTLRVGDTFAAGIFPGKVRMLINENNERKQEVTPSMPIRVIGFEGIPMPGDPFQVTENDKIARNVCQKRQELQQRKNAFNAKERALGVLYETDGEEEQELKVIVKGDVLGSVEALKHTLEKLVVENIKLSCIHASAGAINESDIMLASASSADIIGFHVRPTAKAQSLAEQEKIRIYKCNVVYDAVEMIKAQMTGMLAPKLQEKIIGSLVVRKVYKISKLGNVAGAYVTEGQVQRNARVRVYREGEKIHEGKLQSLKRFKDDVKTVETGFECGVILDNFKDIQEGDTVEAFIIQEVSRDLT